VYNDIAYVNLGECIDVSKEWETKLTSFSNIMRETAERWESSPDWWVEDFSWRKE